MLIARGRYLRQNRVAERSVEAVAVTDALLEQWWASGALPLDDEGWFETHPAWRWQTQVIDQQPIDAVDTQMVRLTVSQARPSKPPIKLLQIDILTPVVQTEEVQQDPEAVTW